MSRVGAPTRVGVDIAATEVRAVMLGRADADGYVEVEAATAVPLEEGAVVAGQVRQPTIVSRALSAALRDIKAPRRGFILGAGGPRALAVRRRLPSELRDDEIVGAIRLSGEPLSAKMPLEDATLAVNRIKEIGSGEQSLVEVVVAAVPTADIDTLRQTCELAKVQPGRIDLSAAGLVRSLVRVPPDSEDIGTIVDIGATQTSVATFQGRHLRSLSVLNTGGDEITRRLAAASGVAWVEAEQAKRVIRVADTVRSGKQEPSSPSGYGDDEDEETTRGKSGATSAERAVIEAAEALVEQITQVIEYDASKYPRMTMAVSLTGGGSQMIGLKTLLSERVSLQSFIGSPWARVSPKAKRLGPLEGLGAEQLAARMISFVAAFGLARGAHE